MTLRIGSHPESSGRLHSRSAIRAASVSLTVGAGLLWALALTVSGGLIVSLAPSTATGMIGVMSAGGVGFVAVVGGRVFPGASPRLQRGVETALGVGVMAGVAVTALELVS